MLHARIRQTLAVVVAVAVMCSFVGTPVATAAALGDETSSGLDGLSSDRQTSADSPSDGGSTDDGADDDGSSTDDGSTDDSTNDGDGDGGSTDDGADDDSSSDGADDDTNDDRTLHDDSGDDDRERRSDSSGELVNETVDAVENTTGEIEDSTAAVLDVDEDALDDTVDRVVTYAELEAALGLDVFEAGPLESEPDPTGPTYTYDHSTRTDPGQPPASDHGGAAPDTAAAASDDDEASGDGDDGPEPANPAGGAGIGVGAVATAAALRGSPVVSGSRAARSGGLLSRLLEKVRPFVLPLRYSRYDDSDPLEHEARERVYDIVNETPGSYLSEVSQEADLPLSTTRHHIKILEREDLVSGAKIHGKRRFYPAYAEGIELAAALNDDSTASIIRAIAHVGAASVSDLADELGRDPSTISHHLQRLEEDGVITRERDGRAVVNKLSPEARTALEPETAHGAAERSEAVAGGAD